MKVAKIFYWIALIILIIGGINWGLVGVLDYNLVDIVFGDIKYLSMIIYTLVGISALYVAILAAKLTKKNQDL